MPSAAEVIATVLAERTGADAMLDPGEFAAAVDREMQARGGYPNASRFSGRSTGPDGSYKPFFRLDDGVAIITIVGELVNRGAWLGASSGLVSYEGINAQLRSAKRDGDVRGLLVDLQTPGGEAVGAMECAEVMREVAAEKPVVAVTNGMAASAGYAIASGATEVVTTATGLSGSIGVVMLHVDQSGRLKQNGLKPTLIHAGAHKVDGNSFGPLSEEVAADMQAEVDAFYDLFVETVAAGRQGMTADQIRATEARTFIGQKAVDAGLADRVGTFETALADLKAGRIGRSQSTKPKGTTLMSDQTQAPAAAAAAAAAAPIIAAASAAAPAAAAPAATVNEAEVRAAAASATKERIKAITTCDAAKGRETLANHLAFNTEMSVEEAKATLAASPQSAAAVDPLITVMNGAAQPNLGPGGEASRQTETSMSSDDIYAARRKASGLKT
ncbi:S49 family peptidase [Caulobacter sp. 1776]|uniref:S49 family peptidase n=1 Tax=Caulobacter sp. 1776 TaxID=3156420 RepID=UPI00339633F2